MAAPTLADAPVAPAEPETSAIPVAARTARLLSVDVLRGLDVLLMLFVNEMAGVAGTPSWLLHTASRMDGMTITDTVFPAFLFITGMSIPLALGARMARGDRRAAIWRHVVVRSLSLIVLGVFMVDAEYGAPAGILSLDVWNVLMTLAMFLVWQTPSTTEGARRWSSVRAAAIVGLVALAFLYRSTDGAGVMQMRPHWWGILGLIGWAYLVAASAFLLIGAKPGRLLAVAAALYGLFFLDHAGVVSWLVAFREVINVGEVLGSQGALAVTGTALVAWFLHARDREMPLTDAASRVAAYGVALVVAGLALHQFKDVSQAFWINKVMATPAWCLIAGGLTAIVWAALLIVVERAGWARWPAAVTIAGEQALLIYLLAPLLASLLALSAPLTGGQNLYAALGRPLLVGTVRSIMFAWVVVRLAGWLRARGLRLRL
jgi:predicted acyltransferase